MLCALLRPSTGAKGPANTNRVVLSGPAEPKRKAGRRSALLPGLLECARLLCRASLRRCQRPLRRFLLPRQTVRQSDSQTVRRSESKTVSKSDGQRVRESESQKVRRSESQTVRESESQTVRESDGQRVRESESETVRESDGQSQRVRESESQRVRVRESDSQCPLRRFLLPPLHGTQATTGAGRKRP
eukprot:5397802-Pyramimonas_sp.AAC.1